MVHGDFVLLFFAALIGFFGGVMLYAVSVGDVGSGVGVASAPEGLSVMYLYPLRCVDCGKRVPPTCDSCVTYYSDSGVLSAISRDVGVPLQLYVSDSVSEPTLLVAKDGVLYLGDGRTKLAISGNLCNTLGNEESCRVFSDRMFTVKKCFASYNISADTLVYQYSESCGHCGRVAEALDKLLELDYLGRKYEAVSIDTFNEAEIEVLSTCAGDIVNTRYVPNVFCPANGRAKTGEIGFPELRDFADECIEAAGVGG